jgi:hypothetical protein
MANEEESPIEEELVDDKPAKKDKPAFYKGYVIRWLKAEDQKNHPDRHLVDEYDKKYGKVAK